MQSATSAAETATDERAMRNTPGRRFGGGAQLADVQVPIGREAGDPDQDEPDRSEQCRDDEAGRTETQDHRAVLSMGAAEVTEC